MAIKQVSVFVENKPGKLLQTIRKLADAQINIRAMSIAETNDFGILRLIVSDLERTKAVLSEDSLLTVTDVIAVEMKDEAGTLSTILAVLDQAGIDIEYMYAFTASTALGAYVVLRVQDNEKAEQALCAAGIRTLNGEHTLSD